MNLRPQSNLAMRPLLPEDVPLLAEIFRASIEELTAEDYSEAQQEAWAETADDLDAFGAKLAAARGAKEVTVEASDTASGFFEKRGYIAKSRNTVLRAGEWLANTTMVKPLAANGSPA